MSDISSIRSNTNLINNSNTALQSSVSTASNQVKSNSTSTTNASDNIVNDEYGPIVSVSKDGDTLRVKTDSNQDSIYDLSDPLVEANHEMVDFHVNSPVTQEIKQDTSSISESIAEASTEPGGIEKYLSEITSYVGFTDSELKQLYLKGLISQIDYTVEMDSRNARKEAAAEENAVFSDSISDRISKISDIDRDAKTVNSIESGNTSDTLSDQIRMQALQNFDTN